MQRKSSLLSFLPVHRFGVLSLSAFVRTNTFRIHRNTYDFMWMRGVLRFPRTEKNCKEQAENSLQVVFPSKTSSLSSEDSQLHAVPEQEALSFLSEEVFPWWGVGLG